MLVHALAAARRRYVREDLKAMLAVSIEEAQRVIHVSAQASAVLLEEKMLRASTTKPQAFPMLMTRTITRDVMRQLVDKTRARVKKHKQVSQFNQEGRGTAFSTKLSDTGVFSIAQLGRQWCAASRECASTA